MRVSLDFGHFTLILLVAFAVGVLVGFLIVRFKR